MYLGERDHSFEMYLGKQDHSLAAITEVITNRLDFEHTIALWPREFTDFSSDF